MEILNSYMIRVSVSVTRWDYKGQGEPGSEVEDERADLGEGVDYTEDGDTSAQNS